jgi:hypothetical protein
MSWVTWAACICTKEVLLNMHRLVCALETLAHAMHQAVYSLGALHT